LARTGIGLVAGILFGGLWKLLSMPCGDEPAIELATPLFFALLIPVRIAEWCLLIHMFFDIGLFGRRKDTNYAALGTIWSSALNAVGIFAAFVGFWIC
jgi:hypothetical protein